MVAHAFGGGNTCGSGLACIQRGRHQAPQNQPVFRLSALHHDWTYRMRHHISRIHLLTLRLLTQLAVAVDQSIQPDYCHMCMVAGLISIPSNNTDGQHSCYSHLPAAQRRRRGANQSGVISVYLRGCRPSSISFIIISRNVITKKNK